MAKISENKIWRIIARIDDEIIIKQASSVEKVTRSARNAVCQRLCDSAGIEYELDGGRVSGTKQGVTSLTTS